MEAAGGDSKVVVLEVKLHCDGCVKDVRKAIVSLRGVDSVFLDKEHDRAVVTGSVDASALVKVIRKKTRKVAHEVLPLAPEEDTISVAGSVVAPSVAGSHRSAAPSVAGSHRSSAGSHRSAAPSVAGSHRSAAPSVAGSHRSAAPSVASSHRSVASSHRSAASGCVVCRGWGTGHAPAGWANPAAVAPGYHTGYGYPPQPNQNNPLPCPACGYYDAQCAEGSCMVM